MKTILIIAFSIFLFAIIDACKPANEWLGTVYVNDELVGVCEVVVNGDGGYKGEVLKDTVERNGITQYETIVLIHPL